MIGKKYFILEAVISNSSSKHRSNNDNLLTPESLVEVLKEYKNKISAFFHVNCRQKTPNVYGRLVKNRNFNH